MDDIDLLEEIIDLAQTLIRFPTVTVGDVVRFPELQRATEFIVQYLQDAQLEVKVFDQEDYPAILAGFPQQLFAPVMFGGHFDVVAPDPDDSQFIPSIEEDYLIGRGAADMKTVLATVLVWMKEMRQSGRPYPPINLLLVANEERGEDFPMGTPHVLKYLATSDETIGYAPQFFIAGERTEESGASTFGQICTQNRGVMRFLVYAEGDRNHTAFIKPQEDLITRLIAARNGIAEIAEDHLTLTGVDGWISLVRFPFIHAGLPEVYNITPDSGILGVEVRPVPSDDIVDFFDRVSTFCEASGLGIRDLVINPGIVCDPDNPYLNALIEAVRGVSGEDPSLGKKLAGTSARFAPGGQGVVWGQSGLGPHAKDERHYIPSILPYYHSLSDFGKLAGKIGSGI